VDVRVLVQQSGKYGAARTGEASEEVEGFHITQTDQQ
jgi:hypothetical protein